MAFSTSQNFQILPMILIFITRQGSHGLMVELTKMLAWTHPPGLSICLSLMTAPSNVSRIS